MSVMYSLWFLCEITTEMSGFRAWLVLNSSIEQTSVSNPGSGPVTLLVPSNSSIFCL